MLDFSGIRRDYEHAREHYSLEVPEQFNFAFDVIDANTALSPDKTAIVAVSGDGAEVNPINYQWLTQTSNQFVNALESLGLTAGDFAAVVIPRVPAWYTVMFACMKLGVVSMPGTSLLTGKDIAYRVQKSSAKAVIVGEEHCDLIDAVRESCPTLTTFIVVGEARKGWLSLDDLCTAASDQFDRDARPRNNAEDIMMAYFTSGTTSMPKLVPRSYAYGLAQVATGLFWMDLQPSDLHWTLTDTGWSKAAWGMLFPQFLLGTPFVLYDGRGSFDADLHLRLIKELGVTTFCAPPTVYRLFANMDLSGYDLKGLRRSFGAGEPLNPEAIRNWEKHTGTIIADGYGQTETVNIVANFPDVPVRYGSMGKPVPGFDVDVIDDDGNRLANDEIGHIAVKITHEWPPGLFHGYFTGKGQALDTRAFKNGWYYTGDTATRDEDGYLWFIGRADDLITSAGYRISPFEVESTLIEHNAVVESAVIAKPDDMRGEIVCAFVVLAEGVEGSDELVKEIQDFCKKQSAPFKYPREVRFVESLPKTISGKIRRVELRDSL
jgi:acetyl-CoA synthetase